MFTITTSGEAAFRHDSILGRILDAGLDAEDVEHEDALTISRMHDAHTLVWGWEARTTDLHDVDAMKAANPASWISKAYLRMGSARTLSPLCPPTVEASATG